MSLYDDLRKNLTPELFTQVTDALGDDFDFDQVPRSRLNRVIKQRNQLREQLAGTSQTQPQGKAKSTREDDDDDELGNEPNVDIEELKKQLKAQSDAQVQAVRIQYAALEKLRAANVVDPDMLWSSNLFNKDEIKFDKDGNLVGMDDVLTQLQKDKGYLFKQAESDVPAGTGKESGEGFEGVTSKEAFLKLDIDQQIAFKKAHPETFKTFMA